MVGAQLTDFWMCNRFLFRILLPCVTKNVNIDMHCDWPKVGHLTLLLRCSKMAVWNLSCHWWVLEQYNTRDISLVGLLTLWPVGPYLEPKYLWMKVSTTICSKIEASWMWLWWSPNGDCGGQNGGGWWWGNRNVLNISRNKIERGQCERKYTCVLLKTQGTIDNFFLWIVIQQ